MIVQMTTTINSESTQLLFSPSCLNIFAMMAAPAIKPMANMAPYHRMVMGSDIRLGLKCQVMKFAI